MNQITSLYQNSTPIQQLIFKDILEDIYASLFNRSNQTKGIQVIEAANQILPIYNLILSHEKTVDENGYFEGMPNPFTELKEGRSEDFLALKNWMETSAKDIHVFPIWKKKTLFLNNDNGKNIVEAYGSLFSESIDEINQYRQVWIQTLILNQYMEFIPFEDFFHDAFGFINLDDIPDGRDKFFLDRFSNETLATQTNAYQGEFLLIGEVINNSIKEVESEILLFRCDTQKIHKLYEEIHGRDEQYNTMQFSEDGYFTYQGEIAKFTQHTMQFYVLDFLLNRKHPEYPEIYAAYDSRGYIDDFLNTKQINKIRNAVNDINKRLRREFSEEKQFFGCEKGSVVIKIGKK